MPPGYAAEATLRINVGIGAKSLKNFDSKFAI